MSDRKFVLSDTEVPTYKEVEASILKASEEEMEVSVDEKDNVRTISYNDGLSDQEALEATAMGAIRQVSGTAQIINGDDGTYISQQTTAKRTKEVLGHKYWERETFDYRREYHFDRDKRLTETYGKIEGRKTYEYDEKGRLAKVNDFGYGGKDREPISSTQIEYDEQDRIIKHTHEKARFGMYKFRDGEKVKTKTSITYDKSGDFVATEHCSVDGHSEGDSVKIHCSKDGDILSEKSKNQNLSNITGLISRLFQRDRW